MKMMKAKLLNQNYLMLKPHKLSFYSYRKATLSLIELLRVYNLKHNKESLT